MFDAIKEITSLTLAKITETKSKDLEFFLYNKKEYPWATRFTFDYRLQLDKQQSYMEEITRRYIAAVHSRIQEFYIARLPDETIEENPG